MNHNKRVFALGFFDGVHLGHQALLSACRDLARELDCETAAITFEQHPQSLFRVDVPPLLTSVEDRRRLLQLYGVEEIIAFPVTKEVMSTPWEEFLEKLIGCGAAGFVCGYDFRFGNRGEGNGERLVRFCRERNLPCVIVPEQTLDGVRISSTHIRNLIENGQMEEAVRYLGHRHILTGQVVTGRKLGHKLGFPTANVLLPEGVVYPKSGVYACRVNIGGLSRIAVTNVGNRPTVEGHQIRTESWILDFDGNLYDREITLEFCGFLRSERKFDSLEDLKQAVLRDAQKTREYFGNKEKAEN